jgi:hypothetical protein
VHNLVGSDYDPATKGPILPYGFMTDLLTAARDPIFWLHHSNIDRLWQMWLDLDPAHKNPTNNAWLKTAFTFAAPGGGTKSWNVSDVLDTTELGYQYDTVAPPRVLVAVGWGRRRTAASGSRFLSGVPRRQSGTCCGITKPECVVGRQLMMNCQDVAVGHAVFDIAQARHRVGTVGRRTRTY